LCRGFFGSRLCKKPYDGEQACNNRVTCEKRVETHRRKKQEKKRAGEEGTKSAAERSGADSDSLDRSNSWVNPIDQARNVRRKSAKGRETKRSGKRTRERDNEKDNERRLKCK